MYTVKELIEALKKCPADYSVKVTDNNFYDLENIESVAINTENETVNLFLKGVKTIMLCAAEARSKATEILEKGLTSELKDIEEQIISAINNGEFGVHNEGTISQNAKKILVDKGYEIDIGHQYNEQYYIIRW